MYMGLFSTKEGAGIFNAVFIATGEKFAAVVDDCFLLLLYVCTHPQVRVICNLSSVSKKSCMYTCCNVI
jgi:hypothetical protein